MLSNIEEQIDWSHHRVTTIDHPLRRPLVPGLPP